MKRTEWAAQILSVLSLTFTKLSVVLLYRRIFRGELFNKICSGLITIIGCWGISFFFATVFECFPIRDVWVTLYGQPRSCYNYLPMFFATAISNFIIDVMILATPMPLIWKLHMPVQQKAAVTGIFLLGAFVCGISIARIYFFVQASRGFDNNYDVTYNLAPTIYWTQLESAIAVISACLPTLRPFFTSRSPESIINTWRSKLSLIRFGSSRSLINSKNEGYNEMHLFGDENNAKIESSVNTVPMRDLEALRSDGEGISVQKSFSRFNGNVE
ncbi:integral membrane protein [Rutstroemia sp. NJR-2017a BVV2]|nr:integral membrane protein [Rutstroemia sp. NJR-2017a BVV2]